MRECDYCSKRIPRTIKFCYYCGKKQDLSDLTSGEIQEMTQDISDTLRAFTLNQGGSDSCNESYHQILIALGSLGTENDHFYCHHCGKLLQPPA